MAQITKQHALAIARKLKATKSEKSSRIHDLMDVCEQGILLASFGIRRGSKKDLGHDHIPSDLHIGPRDARRLAQCPLSRDGWLSILKDKGLLPDSCLPANDAQPAK